VQHENRIRTPAIVSMVFVLEGYIFINSEPKMIWEIAEAALKIEGVKRAHAVTGQFDVVAYAEFANMDMLRRIITELQSLNGVQRTQTAVAIPPRLK
jgi:DNA-binding Lrp family transcriptional regulator